MGHMTKPTVLQHVKGHLVRQLALVSIHPPAQILTPLVFSSALGHSELKTEC